MESTKETKELVKEIFSLGKDLVGALKDGVQVTDAAILLAHIDPIKNALDGMNKVGVEMKDLSKEEMKELLAITIDGVYELIEAAKK